MLSCQLIRLLCPNFVPEIGLAMGVTVWDNPIMKIVADSRGRLTAADLFRPGTAFDANRMMDGRIILAELRPKEVPTVRPRRINGRLTGGVVALSKETIAAAIRADRDER